ncbi:His-Xaa-Ser system radical SAM maturase HxsC [Sphingopyxis lindanitolerans]|uniref:His-Xaa-Ser system radical SAM maturase HxsC n=1 Tax=Sphingopyxis lindanitolerans TaxID=2054227 RepID=A0A2S8B310_9SPHN|nr:His-Xaa-Ser system radical SAM maturase HxsC [Sphingopyxis lindanitolerans]PQM26733.1 His-Xaa-Ser system radical SAM maturase HxsC [Sphingopyxis lindanitolerans]
MIPLLLPATSEARRPFVCRVQDSADNLSDAADALIVGSDVAEYMLSGRDGVFAVGRGGTQSLAGDVLLVDPENGRAERIFRHGSRHNTLLVTERCDQLCVMCSQPPKKTHVDRFAYFEEACLLSAKDSVIGISGGEPTLYKEELFRLIERTAEVRPDVGFHILSNGQHFTADDIERLRQPAYRNMIWGIPLYAPNAPLHDEIVGKADAYARLLESFAVLMRAGARVELRTVLLSPNVASLPMLARFITRHLGFIECWSIMQLENIGFAKNRWSNLYVDHRRHFGEIAAAIDTAQMRHVPVRLFNFPRCTVPANYRDLAPASISDWKRKYAPACEGCNEREACAGFFEWHPDADIGRVTPL